MLKLSIVELINNHEEDISSILLEKYFIKDIDYKILLHQMVEQVYGGHNNKTILQIKKLTTNRNIYLKG